MKTTNVTTRDEKILSVSFWRERFLTARKCLGKKPIIRCMSEIDNYYNTVDGMNDFKNVSRCKAGLARTRRAVLTIEKYLETNAEPVKKNYLKKIKA